jgi:drug/metabolite transporter (DMT)-like permease
MSLGAGIFLIALGAVFTFAIRGDLGWLDIQATGVVLMLTGLVIVGMVVMVRRRRRGTVTQERTFHDGQPETVSETRVYRDDDDPTHL